MGLEVSHLLAAGALLFNEQRFWDAHEEWEKAWNLLRREGRPDDANLVQGLILATAAYENLSHGKPRGALTQFAKAIRLCERHRARAHALGVRDIDPFLVALAAARAEVNAGARIFTDLASPPPRVDVTP